MTKRRPDGRRMQTWVIRAEIDGSHTLLHGNRLIADRLSLADAKGQMKHVPGERVFFEESDGYRHRLKV